MEVQHVVVVWVEKEVGVGAVMVRAEVVEVVAVWMWRRSRFGRRRSRCAYRWWRCESRWWWLRGMVVEVEEVEEAAAVVRVEVMAVEEEAWVGDGRGGVEVMKVVVVWMGREVAHMVAVM